MVTLCSSRSERGRGWENPLPPTAPHWFNNPYTPLRLSTTPPTAIKAGSQQWRHRDCSQNEVSGSLCLCSHSAGKERERGKCCLVASKRRRNSPPTTTRSQRTLSRLCLWRPHSHTATPLFSCLLTLLTFRSEYSVNTRYRCTGQ